MTTGTDDAPLDPPARDAPARDAPAGGGSEAEVLDKLEALLGRLRVPDTPAEQGVAHPGIPTLDQPVTWLSAEASPSAVPAGRHIPTLTESVQLRGSPDAEPPQAAPATQAAQAPTTTTATQPAPDPISRQELRERVQSLLDPTLEDRLCERAMIDLDRTLIDVERGLRDELEAWRIDREAQIRDQVRGEIERAVDEVVAALARERGGGLH